MGTANGWLVTDFLLRWTKPSHLGLGSSTTDAPVAPGFLEDIVVHAEDVARDVSFDNLPVVLHGVASGHYGDPDGGCASDEDVVLAGTGRVCAPRIGTDAVAASGEPAAPKCKLGGSNAGGDNGCPVDAMGENLLSSRAQPTCVAIGNTTDPYTEGSFHCLLMCPCIGQGNDCGEAAHAHCPSTARCERGVLRNRAHGICTYHGSGSETSLEPIIVA